MNHIEQVNNCLIKSKTKLYPIENNRLSTETDFLKNGYMKMLAVIFQQCEDISNDQLVLFERIKEGINTEYSVEDYLRMALTIKIDDFLNFCSEVKESELKYRFIFDAIVLSVVGKNNKRQLELVAEISEMLEIKKDELKYLSTVAKSIVCVDMLGYVDMYFVKLEGIPDYTFCDYVKLFSDKPILENHNTVIFQSTCEANVTIENLKYVISTDKPFIKLVNMEVDLAEFSMQFYEKKKIHLERCKIIGGEYSIEFTHCEEVVISNCFVSDFKTSVICFSDIKKMSIINTVFKNCKESSCEDFFENELRNLKYFNAIMSNRTPDYIGCIFSGKIENNGRVYIDKSTFVDCGHTKSFDYNRFAFIPNCVSEVKDTKFENCCNYNRDDVGLESYSGTMFPPNSTAIGCEYINSANFC
ncbi:hypothetical protein [Filifactor alocis]|uniref:hypothetical protein n=1 Tax=Filifactor alocis TaxID=143361 RepID=UPI003FA1657D